MTIRDDASAVLALLAEYKEGEDDARQGRHVLFGDVITQALNMPPSRVNDAVEVLEGQTLVKTYNSLGSRPYNFRQVCATPKGRNAVEDGRRSLAERNGQKKDHGSWESYPESDGAELVPLLRRAAFDRDLARACSEAGPDRPVGLLMVDIDHFKKVNDTCGHPGGDKVLIGVAEALRRVVGRRGRCYRYGGEELSVVLPDTSCEEAVATAERFRLAVEQRGWTDAGFPTLRVTVSVGVSEYPTIGADHETLLATADRALYSAKTGGRNRVEAARVVDAP